MSELFIVVGLKARAGKADALRRDLAALVEPSRQEDGNIRYDLFEDQDEQGQFVFVEEWASPEARARHHLKGPHIQDFHAEGVGNVETTTFAHTLRRLSAPPRAAGGTAPGARTFEPVDYDAAMAANLSRVFSERDAGRRLAAIGELYAEDAVLYEPDGAVSGHHAISEAVTRLLASLPADFTFRAEGPAVGHHGIGRLKWAAGPPSGPIAVTGIDVAQFEHGRIRALHVFLDPPADSGRS